MAAFSSFWPSFPFLTSFLTFLLPRPFHLGPWFTLVFFVIQFLSDVFFLCFFPITEEYHRSKDDKDWRNRSQIDKVDRDVTKRKAQAQMISNSSDVEHTWPTVSFPGPPRAIAYLCTIPKMFGSFSAFHVLLWVLKLKENHNTPNYFNSLSLIFGFEVAVAIF